MFSSGLGGLVCREEFISGYQSKIILIKTAFKPITPLLYVYFEIFE